MAGMKGTWIDGALFVLASPVLLISAARRVLSGTVSFTWPCSRPLLCECGSTVSLVGCGNAPADLPTADISCVRARCATRFPASCAATDAA